MTVCKVLLHGLKPCDLSSSTNDKISDASPQRQQALIPPTLPKSGKEKSLVTTEKDFLNLDIKPLTTPTSSRSSTSSDISHESSPIRVMIRETPRGRHHICVSQTLLRTHAGDV